MIVIKTKTKIFIGIASALFIFTSIMIFYYASTVIEHMYLMNTIEGQDITGIIIDKEQEQKRTKNHPNSEYKTYITYQLHIELDDGSVIIESVNMTDYLYYCIGEALYGKKYICEEKDFLEYNWDFFSELGIETNIFPECECE